MLSMANISVGQASSGYYRQDGYYAKDGDEAKEASLWFGKGAEAAGLSGNVDPKTFDDVMKGINPDGVQMGRKNSEGQIEHRAGTDLTFSPSKSVSIVGLVGGDERVIQAHDAAVKTALAHVEEKFLNTRIWNAEKGAQETVGDQKMFAGVFRHNTSRNMDPQLHSHAVVANMTIGEDGKWRSIDNSKIFDNQHHIGGVYQNALAQELTSRGFDIERVGKHGYVEIKGIPEDLKELFSTRREEIKEALKGSDYPASAAAAARVAVFTRNAKEQNVDRAALLQVWRDEAAAKGLDAKAFEALRDATSRSRELNLNDRRADADKAVTYAIAHISERASVYQRDAVELAALSVTKQASHVDIAASIERKLSSGDLIQSVAKGFENALTDKVSIRNEIAVLDEYSFGKGAGKPQATERIVTRAIRTDTLNDGQMNAVKTALTTEDRVVGVQGYAGTGKTYMLAKMQAVAEKQGYEVVGLAPSDKAVDELNAVGIKSGTLQGFLARNQGLAEGRMSAQALSGMTAEYSNKMIVVDEASMIDTGQMRDLLHIANRIDAPKVVLLGDTKQLDAVGAGTPFHALQNEGMKLAVMNDIRRQENPMLLAAVLDTIKGHIHAAFEKVGDGISSHGQEAPQKAGEAWLALSSKDRAATLLITQSNDWRRIINGVVREGLREEGALTGPDVAVTRLEDLRFSKAEAARMENYEPGMTVIAERTLRGQGFEKGTEFAVVGTSDKGVELRQIDGNRIYFDPSKSAQAANAMSVFQEAKINLAAGDSIRFDRSAPLIGIANKATGDVQSIDDKSIIIKLHGEEEARTFSRSDALMKHIDHGFSITVHGAQGATINKVISALNSASVLSTMKSFYVTISRAKEEAQIFTDDVGKLRDVISKATGERVSALDAIGFRDAVRNLNAVHVEEAKTRNGGAGESNVYFLKFGDEKPFPELRATRDDREPNLPGLERPKADDPEIRGSRTQEHDAVQKDKTDRTISEDDEGKERRKEPQEDRLEQELRNNQEQHRGAPQRDQSDDKDRGFER